jgi:hypothetical protein
MPTMAVLRLKGALLLGALASLSIGTVSAQRNYSTSYSDLDMSRVHDALMASRPDDCPPW